MQPSDAVTGKANPCAVESHAAQVRSSGRHLIVISPAPLERSLRLSAMSRFPETPLRDSPRDRGTADRESGACLYGHAAGRLWLLGRLRRSSQLTAPQLNNSSMNQDSPDKGGPPSPRSKTPIIPTHLLFCYEWDDSKEVVRQMEELNLDVIPVVDAERRLIGMFRKPKSDGSASPKIIPERVSSPSAPIV
jgi:CBS domain-containing protein